MAALPPRPAEPQSTAVPVAETTAQRVQFADRDGLWLSPKLMDLMLARWADAIGRKYDLKDEQRAKLREMAVSRWGGFLRDNASTVQPVINDLIEMRLGLEPPEKKHIQEWAKQALPVFEQVRGQLQASTQDFRQLLDPQQRVEFEVDALKLRVGLQWAQQKLEQWGEGEVDPDDLWTPPGERRERRAELGRRREESKETAKSAGSGEKAAGAEKDQVLQELELWDRYVQSFMRLYQLDEGQRDAVLSVLNEMKERALAHRERHREDIERLEERIGSFSGSDEELEALKKELTELYGPIDDMFNELKERIEQIPTASQRAMVARQAE